MKKKAGRNTLLMSVVMSAPGPLVVGLGLFMGKSTTQLADFFRRTAELLAIIASFIVYSLTNRDGVEDTARKAKLERLTNGFVGAMMFIAGISMILVTILSESTEKGNVIPGLSIAVMGVIANTIFWFRYSKLWRVEKNEILRVQSRLYRAKSFVDICVTTALTIVAIYPESVAAVYFDKIGSIIVAIYLAWCGIKTIKESKVERNA